MVACERVQMLAAWFFFKENFSIVIIFTFTGTTISSHVSYN